MNPCAPQGNLDDVRLELGGLYNVYCIASAVWYANRLAATRSFYWDNLYLV